MNLRRFLGWAALAASTYWALGCLIFFFYETGTRFSGPLMDWICVLGIFDAYAATGKSWAFVPLILFLIYKFFFFGLRAVRARPQDSKPASSDL